MSLRKNFILIKNCSYLALNPIDATWAFETFLVITYTFEHKYYASLTGFDALILFVRFSGLAFHKFE